MKNVHENYSCLKKPPVNVLDVAAGEEIQNYVVWI